MIANDGFLHALETIERALIARVTEITSRSQLDSEDAVSAIHAMIAALAEQHTAIVSGLRGTALHNAEVQLALSTLQTQMAALQATLTEHVAASEADRADLRAQIEHVNERSSDR